VADGGVTIPEAQPEDTALFLHTSGTTGKPKGVRPSRTTRSRAVSGDLGQSRAVSGNFGRSRVISGDLGRSRVISGDSSQGAALARKHARDDGNLIGGEQPVDTFVFEAAHALLL